MSWKRLKTAHQPPDGDCRTSGNEGGLFMGLNFYILPTGIGSTRRKVFETQAVKHGGSVSGSVNKETTHVIVDETVTLEKLQNVLKWTSIPAGVKVVRSKWFSNCIKFSDCIDSKEHELNSPTVEASCPDIKTPNNVKPTAGTSRVDKTEDEFLPVVAATDAHVAQNLQAKWICSIPSNQNPENFNKHITDKLEVLSTAYKNTNDHWRFLGYQKAIMALKKHPKAITSWEEAKSLRGVGERLADKIWEIVQSGHLRKIDEVCSGKKMEAISLFNKVSGIGPSTAETFVQQGFYTLEDLKAGAKLTKIQQIGLKYFNEFQERMPRSEAAEIIALVNDVVASIDSRLQSVACGSYRRGRETCGDIDILVTHPDGMSHRGVLPKIVSVLHDANIMTDDMVSQEENGSHNKYMGVCKLPYGKNKHRRIDIIVVPCSEYACALMHFTGSAHFNRSIRLLASTKNMSLSEHSLRSGVVREGTKKVSEGCVLVTPTEESIFKYLGLDYRVPEERDHFAIE